MAAWSCMFWLRVQMPLTITKLSSFNLNKKRALSEYEGQLVVELLLTSDNPNEGILRVHSLNYPRYWISITVYVWEVGRICWFFSF